MNILSIDSSSKVATIALLNEDTLLGEYILNDKKEHSVILMPMIQKLLKECNLNINDIDGYVVSKGPGSFTGLRIGMATIKGMSLGSQKPYASVSSLEALAYNVLNYKGIICPIIDALRENVYTAIYESNGNNLEPLLLPTSMDIDKLIDKLKEYNQEVLFIGDALNKHKNYIVENLNSPIFPPNHLNITRASSLGEIGLQLLKNNKADDSNSSPIYLKKPQAERELERRLQMNGCNS